MTYDLAKHTRQFYKYLSGLETISYSSAVEGGTYQEAVSVTNVKRRAVDKKLYAHIKASILCHFHIWEDILHNLNTPFVPKRTDKFIDSEGLEWIVLEVEVHSIQNRYRCLCYLKHDELYLRNVAIDPDEEM